MWRLSAAVPVRACAESPSPPSESVVPATASSLCVTSTFSPSVSSVHAILAEHNQHHPATAEDGSVAAGHHLLLARAVVDGHGHGIALNHPYLAWWVFWWLALPCLPFIHALCTSFDRCGVGCTLFGCNVHVRSTDVGSHIRFLPKKTIIIGTLQNQALPAESAKTNRADSTKT